MRNLLLRQRQNSIFGSLRCFTRQQCQAQKPFKIMRSFYHQNHRLSFSPSKNHDRCNRNVRNSTSSFVVPTKEDAIELFRLMNNRPGSLLEDDSECLKYNQDWTVSK